MASSRQGAAARAREVRRRDGALLATGATWVGAVVLAVLAMVVMAACGGGSGSSTGSAKHAASAKPTEDLVMTAADFHNINTMTRVRGFFVDNRLGHLDETLRVANSATGGTYPVGTILQLVPQEAMVKRRPGFSPATHDWEFFSLQTTAAGTAILTRGGADVVNRFGGSCAGCHGAAQPQFDMVCEHSHGCAPLPISDAVIAAIQRVDPRPRPPAATP